MQNRKKAFGILEVLLAGVIIIIILSALVVVARQSIDNSVYLQQRSQATFLAQEGVEVVRQIRDTNYIDGTPTTKWDTLVGNTSALPIAMNQNYNITVAGIPARFRLNQAATGEQINVGGTVFSRTIKFTQPDRAQLYREKNINYDSNPVNPYPGYKVTVNVSWLNNGQSKNVEISEIVANSRQGF